ncbi:hypothetical protein HaLaN_15557 [Haematococcus lacustris]|uniref:Uncharacterized protein n=1 Tax=Haematococcus lacustris TaxID=44745 RepID=A0A699ZH03_HAELA|nr:hypothetical protein HaLaN_15557 [Haematococcus lacustris]
MKQRILQQRLHAQESSCFTYRPAVQARTAPRLLPQRQNHSVSVTFASEASTAASETLMAVPAVKVVGLGLTGLNAILGLLGGWPAWLTCRRG